MIPKIIHYCWFGGSPLPPLAKKCIASWKKFLPAYEIREWNETNFDVNRIPYTAEAYRQKKYAFVSDYARFCIIYQHGGIYFDTDVEVIRSMDDIIARGNFMGFEVDPDGENTPGRYAPRYCFAINLGLGFGMETGHPFMRRMMDYYETLPFVAVPQDIAWYKTIVAYTTEQLCAEGLQNVRGIQRVANITIYPSEYFAPIQVMSGKMHITPQTHTIHRYMGSWATGKKSLKERFKRLLPEWVFVLNNRIKRRKYKVQP